MPYRYLVLGAGRQGAAIAYDLARNGEAISVSLVDSNANAAQKSARRLNHLLGKKIIVPASARLDQATNLKAHIKGKDSVVSALPYFLNLQAAKISLEGGAHFCDLGGNTEIVEQELRLDALARKNGVTCSPDCGLAPGLSNLLAARSFEKLEKVDEIHVRCGGLPQRPRPPFGYKYVFSLHGLVNEYSGDAIFLRAGKIVRIPALTEFEEIEIPKIGLLEAAVTTGGTSTAPYSFRGRVRDFDYKTLRYPGHFSIFRGFSDLGLFAMDQRESFFKLLQPKIDFPKDRDLVILRVVARGKKNRKNAKYQATLIDRGDAKTGFTAMERTTGFPTAAIAYLQASKKIPIGAKPIEVSVPLAPLMSALALRGLKIQEKVT